MEFQVVLFFTFPCGGEVEGFNLGGGAGGYKCHDYICISRIFCGQYYKELFGLGKQKCKSVRQKSKSNRNS